MNRFIITSAYLTIFIGEEGMVLKLSSVLHPGISTNYSSSFTIPTQGRQKQEQNTKRPLQR
jgi:hypothetical protein